MLNVFETIEFCNEKNNGNYIIKDIYGKDIDLREIDVIHTHCTVYKTFDIQVCRGVFSDSDNIFKRRESVKFMKKILKRIILYGE